MGWSSAMLCPAPAGKVRNGVHRGVSVTVWMAGVALLVSLWKSCWMDVGGVLGGCGVLMVMVVSVVRCIGSCCLGVACWFASCVKMEPFGVGGRMSLLYVFVAALAGLGHVGVFGAAAGSSFGGTGMSFGVVCG